MKQLFATAALVLGLVACGQNPPALDTPPAHQHEAVTTEDEQIQGERLTVYAPFSPDEAEALASAFQNETGIHLKIVQTDGRQLLSRLTSETLPPADLILSHDAALLDQLKTAGRTQQATSPKLSVIPKAFRDSNDHWIGLARHVHVIAYDPQVVSEIEVNTYASLADPRLQGEVCLSAIDDLQTRALMIEILSREGETAARAWTQGVSANLARPAKGDGAAQIEAVAAGECAVALTSHHDWLRLANGTPEARLKAARTELSFPDQDGSGVHMNVLAAAIPADAPSSETALHFLEFLATPPGQEALTTLSGDYPLLAKARMPAGLQDLPGFRESDFPLQGRGDIAEEAEALLETSGWNKAE